MFLQCTDFFDFLILKICQKYLNKDRQVQFFFLESIDTGLSANVYLNEMVIKTNSAAGMQRQKWKNAL